ncbi:methionine ABC transporter ATP-binding protein [Bacillus mesophilum]|uniref:ATP-binding cassette domain-containing protein n=1 Tax=Bacillus mesophilum TaxID=1071718 RepID=A0A7V7UW44_9BACI|nr:ATP-binding cassette domain-containing protein [Bacillus mesophilum]KAB2330375.1 ATP-binding cassette domain-containing protein [Bacillus mesophilum]
MITLQNVSKSFSRFEAIKSVTLTIEKGEIHGLVGASGSGKSTLLRLMNLLELPDTGDVEVNGQTLTRLSAKELRLVRKSIGMIFQHFHLVANKTVFDNVAVALQLAGSRKSDIRLRVLECLQFVGLEKMAEKYPAQLSGGQKQRVAIARALANNPQVLLCDEPTSSLDPNTTAEILTVLNNINQQLGVTIVFVSHEMDVVKKICSRVSVMSEGEIYDTVTIEPLGIQAIDNRPEYFVQQLKRDGEE